MEHIHDRGSTAAGSPLCGKSVRGGYLSKWGSDYNRYLVLCVDYPAFSDPCEKLMRFGPGRVENRCDNFHYWSFHPGGANFLFADGLVRFLPYSAISSLAALATRNGGEVVSIPW